MPKLGSPVPQREEESLPPHRWGILIELWHGEHTLPSGGQQGWLKSAMARRALVDAVT